MSFAVIRQAIAATLEGMGIQMKGALLFGSRARGMASQHGDYDILVVTEKTFSPKEKMEISEKIRDALVELRIASDILIESEEEVEYFRGKIGSVVRQALKEAVPL